MSSVRVVARIRPCLPNELSRDTIVNADTRSSVVKIPNPRNPAENHSFHFNAVYDESSTQQDLFDNEVASTVKHLFLGYDTTIFAYGVTGTGKTHTMKGGKSLAERGVIPRLLSAIYRRGRKTEKDSAEAKKIEMTMSYYEIYCDKVFDLFEPVEKRTPTGLPIRDCNGKTVIAGLTERPCDSLKEFEVMYDEANKNRSVGATKLNAHSSRSHAILCVKVSQVEGNKITTSTASAIDLAGSEDNRRTENGKERLVESSAINRSLFVLSQCVEAISKKQARIPYRDSKMTRILGLGQNNGLTLMILNLAPVRSYHLDTLSSLQFANRTKKIEIREVENEPIYKGKQEQGSIVTGLPAHRQPLRALTAAPINTGVKTTTTTLKDKPLKAFSVYSEKSAPGRPSHGRKRPSDENLNTNGRPIKQLRNSGEYSGRQSQPHKGGTNNSISRTDLESLVNRMVEEKLAERTLDVASNQVAPLNFEVQRRLEALEQRVQSQSQDDEKAEGIQYLYMAKQHQARGGTASALRMYELAEPFFPGNEKLMGRMRKLRAILASGKAEKSDRVQGAAHSHTAYHDDNVQQPGFVADKRSKEEYEDDEQDDGGNTDDGDYTNDTQIIDKEAYQSDSSFHFKPKKAKVKKIIARPLQIHHDDDEPLAPPTPRTTTLLRIINTRNISQIKSLKGVGVKKAEGIVNCLLDMGGDAIEDLVGLAAIKGVGIKTVDKMREGIIVTGGDEHGLGEEFEAVSEVGMHKAGFGMALAV